nr:Yip1 family protein [Propionicimonas sp.]
MPDYYDDSGAHQGSSSDRPDGRRDYYADFGGRTGSSRVNPDGSRDYYDDFGARTGRSRVNPDGSRDYYDGFGTRTGSSRPKADYSNLPPHLRPGYVDPNRPPKSIGVGGSILAGVVVTGILGMIVGWSLMGYAAEHLSGGSLPAWVVPVALFPVAGGIVTVVWLLLARGRSRR